jgi:hypothetical protein
MASDPSKAPIIVEDDSIPPPQQQRGQAPVPLAVQQQSVPEDSKNVDTSAVSIATLGQRLSSAQGLCVLFLPATTT